MTDTTMATLDLDELTEQGAEVKVAGVTYHFVRWSALGLLQRHQINKRQSRIDELEKLPEPSDDDAAEYERLVRELVPMVSDMPAEVSDALESEQRQDALSVFLGLRLSRRSMFLAAITMKPTQAPSTTAPSSRGSTASGRKTTRKRG